MSKGYGFVHFEADESAHQAIEQVNGMLLNDRKVFVGRFKTRGDRVREIGEKSKQFTNVFIKNLPEDMTEQELNELTLPFGTTLSSKLMIDETGKSKGFGFASFEDHDSAEKCVTELNQKEIRGKVIYAGRAQKKAERTQELKHEYEKRKQDRQQKFAGVNLYVKNLDDTVTDENLREAFEAHGTITSAKVMSENGVSKGFGFVCFSSPEEATKAVTEMNGRIVGSKPLYVALAQRKEDRKAQLQAQYLQRAGGGQGMRPGFNNMPQAYGQFPMMQSAPSYYMPMGQQRFLAPGGVMPRYGAPGSPRQPFGMPNIRPGMNNRMVPNMPRQPMPNAMGYPMQMQQQRMMMQMGGQPRPNQPFMGQNANNFKYTNNVRNAPNAMDQQVPVGGMQQQAPKADGGELTAAVLAQAAPSEQKQMLGERMYPLVQAEVGAEQAGKVTGMLLEIDNNELLSMLEDSDLLNEKIKEAVNVLSQVQAPVAEE